ncbi:LysR family transcriptional regulator [Sporomusa malonica]|uniref:DNA-binding transcriptional regulator, LysR family n=1 Tax=Sporomusa malonica TaxID=112901 RepID=A0A1W1ZTP8_9FIRM|nr:LysR family transcriptional regulator [Sporomusa malonica]SMC51830.1 DNA-binding transcriptional regulator, LysR family [Sporomusa malonica]
MEIRQLEYFIEVARQKSFSKAAETLHVSQPSISKAIKELENQLGSVLFYRNPKYVELTDAGDAILEQAQQVISSFQNINAQLRGITQMQTGKIHIGLPPITGVSDFAQLLGRFKNEYPNIQINLYEYGSKKIEMGIQDGTLDMGIIYVPCEAEQLYEAISFVQDPLKIVMHPQHPLASKSIVTYQELRNEHFVLYSSDYILHDKIIERCKEAGFSPHIIFETSQRELMTQIVAARLGVALLPSKVCQELNAGTFTTLPMADPQVFLRLAMVWKSRRYLSHAARALIDFVKKQL